MNPYHQPTMKGGWEEQSSNRKKDCVKMVGRQVHCTEFVDTAGLMDEMCSTYLSDAAKAAGQRKKERQWKKGRSGGRVCVVQGGWWVNDGVPVDGWMAGWMPLSTTHHPLASCNTINWVDGVGGRSQSGENLL
jgi:hypothetical protein